MRFVSSYAPREEASWSGLHQRFLAVSAGEKWMTVAAPSEDWFVNAIREIPRGCWRILANSCSWWGDAGDRAMLQNELYPRCDPASWKITMDGWFEYVFRKMTIGKLSRWESTWFKGFSDWNMAIFQPCEHQRRCTNNQQPIPRLRIPKIGIDVTSMRWCMRIQDVYMRSICTAMRVPPCVCRCILLCEHA